MSTSGHLPFGGVWTTIRDEYVALKSIIGPVRLSKIELLGLFFRKTFHDMNLTWQETPLSLRTIIISLVILTIMLSLDMVIGRFSSLSRRGIPVLHRPKGVHRRDYEAILKEGRRQFPDTPYLITYSGYEYVVFPSASFDEVKRLSMSQASLVEWATHVFFQGWRFLGTDNSILHQMIATDLSRALPATVPVRHKNVVQAVSDSVGPCPNWKHVRLYKTVQNVVSRTNAAAFMNPKFASSPWWINAVQLLPMISMVAVFACHTTPRCLRPVVAFFVFFPAWCVYWAMEMMLYPEIKQNMKEVDAAVAEGKAPQLGRQQNMPLTTWLMGRYPPESRSARQIARDYINIAFESTSSTSATVYFIISELATRPGLIRELREEILESMVDGEFPPTSLREWEKMDSVMRESSRVNVFSYLGLHRRAVKPVKLSLGPELPAGALLCVDAYHITMSEDRWENPTEFDPMRFLKLRQQPGHESRHQFTSLGNDSPGFGDGPQACPGRYYAGNTIKIILAHLILNYEIKLDPNASKPKRHSMPNASFAPDLFANIMIRERTMSTKANHE